jgi:hypothetical protein
VWFLALFIILHLPPTSFYTIPWFLIALIVLLIVITLVVLPTIAVARIQWKGMLVGVLAACICTYIRFPVMATGRSTDPPQARYADLVAESEASASLRTLNVALDFYAKRYGSGFVDDLAKLGRPVEGDPDANHAGLLTFYSGGFQYAGSNSVSKRAYLFVYTPKMDSSNTVTGYTIVARPTGHGGMRSFYSDQTCVVRATQEDRPAGASDPPI